jgi:hypothetical protein
VLRKRGSDREHSASTLSKRHLGPQELGSKRAASALRAPRCWGRFRLAPMRLGLKRLLGSSQGALTNSQYRRFGVVLASAPRGRLAPCQPSFERCLGSQSAWQENLRRAGHSQCLMNPAARGGDSASYGRLQCCGGFPTPRLWSSVERLDHDPLPLQRPLSRRLHAAVQTNGTRLR